MSPNLARFVLLMFGVLSIPTTLYPIFDTYWILEKIQNSVDVLEYDTGSFYLILMSLFWVGGVIHWGGKTAQQSNKKDAASGLDAIARYIYDKANKILIGWFIACLVVANVVPRLIVKKLENSGYLACEDVREISRVSRGKSLIFVRYEDCSLLSK